MALGPASEFIAPKMLSVGRGRAIHPTAIIDPRAELAADVMVGPYVVIDGPARIASGTIIYPHTVINGSTVVGRNCRIGPSAYLGMQPQHARFVPDLSNPTYLIIGDNVLVRECARLSLATQPGEENGTRIEDGCYIMGASHVGHDCVVEKNVTLADSALLGGHVHVGPQCFIGGGSTIHQFVHIGRLSIIAGNEAFTHNCPPFAAVRYGRLKAYNAIGCRRAGLKFEAIRSIRACYHRLQAYRNMGAALKAIEAEVADTPEKREIVEFIRQSKRGILPAHDDGRTTGGRDEDPERAQVHRRE